MALEDAAVLEILFANLGNSGQVEERVRPFDKFRRPRALMTQIVSNAGPLSMAMSKQRFANTTLGRFPPWRAVIFRAMT